MTDAASIRVAAEPSLARVMCRPKSLGILAVALTVAVGFAWLGQWQLSSAITVPGQVHSSVETVAELSLATEPGTPVTDEVAGTVLATSGEFIEDDFTVVTRRHNGGHEGAWLVGHLHTLETTQTASRGHLAVALGWAPDASRAERAGKQIQAEYSRETVTVYGRYLPGEAPMRPTPESSTHTLLSLSPAQLVNLWQPFTGLSYPGYLVLHPGPPFDAEVLARYGLEAIDSVPPKAPNAINWLNLFYAAEWLVFAGFAVFFWYRLTRDEWERIHDPGQREHETIAASAAGGLRQRRAAAAE